MLAALSYRQHVAGALPNGGALLRLLPLQAWRAALLADWLQAAARRPMHAQQAALQSFLSPGSSSPAQSHSPPLLVVLGGSERDTLLLLHSLALHCSSGGAGQQQRVAMVHSRHDAYTFGLPTLGSGSYECYVDPEQGGRASLLHELAAC